MAYQKQTFTDNTTVLKTTHLNHIEDGIVAVENAVNGLGIKGSAASVADIESPESTDVQTVANKVNEILAQLKARGVTS